MTTTCFEKYSPGKMVTYCQRNGAIDYGVIVREYPKHLIVNFYGKGNRKVSKNQCLITK